MHVNIAFYFGFLKYFIVVVQLRYLLTGVCSLPIDSYQEFLYALFHPYLGNDTYIIYWNKFAESQKSGCLQWCQKWDRQMPDDFPNGVVDKRAYRFCN